MTVFILKHVKVSSNTETNCVCVLITKNILTRVLIACSFSEKIYQVFITLNLLVRYLTVFIYFTFVKSRPYPIMHEVMPTQ